MLLFRSLNDIGITRTHLSGNITVDIVRIEKQLLAQNRLNNTPSKNDIDLIIKVLKDYPDEIREICNYECLYGILADVDARYLDRLHSHTPEQAARIRFVISNYFNDEITAFINDSIRTEDWNKLSVLLTYKIFLSTELLESISQKLTGKFEYALLIIVRYYNIAEAQSKAAFLTQPTFFMLLGELDARYFRPYLMQLLVFMSKNHSTAKSSSYLNLVVRAMCSFKPTDSQLAASLSGALILTAPVRQKEDSKAGVLFICAISFVFILIFMVAKCGSNTPVQRINPYENQKLEYGTIENANYWKEDQKIKMEDFVEARQLPILYPANSKKVVNNFVYKYQNPFTSEVFTGRYFEIKHSNQPHINIINRTLKQCVVIAYFDEVYNEDRTAYVMKNEDSRHQVYALYIPPNDSIQIDYKMYLLRFYMGHDLRNFNTYKGYVYPDSTDAKFARYTSADSMMFSHAFGLSPESGSKKEQDFIITQPTETSYYLSWTGIGPINLRQYWAQEVYKKNSDEKTPVDANFLLLDLKKSRSQLNDTNKGTVNAFMDY